MIQDEKQIDCFEITKHGKTVEPVSRAPLSLESFRDHHWRHSLSPIESREERRYSSGMSYVMIMNQVNIFIVRITGKKPELSQNGS